MLTTDLLRVRRKKGELVVVPLKDHERARLLDAAKSYLALATPGLSRAELYAAWDAVLHDAADFKLHKGLRKLIEDRCTFEAATPCEPRVLRRELFTRAAGVRREASDTAPFKRDAIVATYAAEQGLSETALEAALFADLEENHRLTHIDPISSEALVESYERAQHQAVLLRATRVVVRLTCADAAGYRAFFRRLKFHRLLYQVQNAEEGYVIEVDGPLSLFSAVTKYGLKLALLVPALEASGRWELRADVLWDKEPLTFTLRGGTLGGTPEALEAPRLPDEVQALMERFQKLETGWQVQIAQALLNLPGVGVCAPDLVFTHMASGARVFLEVLGFWSRAAVWRRVELVQAGLAEKVVFAVSSRLRVSEEALGDAWPSQLYVYKGAMSATAVLERLERARAAH